MNDDLKKRIEAWTFFQNKLDILEEGPQATVDFIDELIHETFILEDENKKVSRLAREVAAENGESRQLIAEIKDQLVSYKDQINFGADPVSILEALYNTLYKPSV